VRSQSSAHAIGARMVCSKRNILGILGIVRSCSCRSDKTVIGVKCFIEARRFILLLGGMQCHVHGNS
jgi:hypothetical protein